MPIPFLFFRVPIPTSYSWRLQTVGDHMPEEQSAWLTSKKCTVSAQKTTCASLKSGHVPGSSQKGSDTTVHWQPEPIGRVTIAFYPRDAMLARVIEIATCLCVRLSVRPSRAGIVSKRRKLAAWLSLIHIWRCRRSTLCRSRWSPYH